MDFFDHQDRAKRNTLLLLCYFAAAVVGIVASVYCVLLGVLVFLSKGSEQPIEFLDWHPRLLGAVVFVVPAVIALGSLYKIWSIGSHGENVAIALGGTKVPPNTVNLDERILLNVVEEMALASGTPVPPVYIMYNETGINAFAAGTTPQNAVIGVTHGAITTLSRDELQGVIAHEFSHILNGDMRLNLRLMGLLHGILVIALIGYVLVRLLGETSGRSSSSSNSDDKGAIGIVAAILIFGACLIGIGYIGVFFANMIKAAVSRQREYLADASAVQFTRNPNGIADALKRIGGWPQHSRMKSARSTEASHMFFGEGVVSYLFATHPALPLRIRRIDPRFDGKFERTELAQHTTADLIDPRSLSLARASFAGSPTLTPKNTQDNSRVIASNKTSNNTAYQPSETTPVVDVGDVHQAAVAGANHHETNPSDAVQQIGEPRSEHLVHAQHIVDEIQPLLVEDVRDPLGAVAIVYALLMAPNDDPVREVQIEFLKRQNDQRILHEFHRILGDVDRIPIEQRFPLACLALPALHQMSPAQVNNFRLTVRGLIEADRKWTIFEYGIHRFVSKRLVKRLDPQQAPTPPRPSSASIQQCVQLVLSMIAHIGTNNAQIEIAFRAGLKKIALAKQYTSLLPREQCTLKNLDAALDTLEQTNGAHKRAMLSSFSACIAADGKVDVAELELLRVISDALGCPMPPILDVPPLTSA